MTLTANPTGQDVAEFLGRGGDAALSSLASAHLSIVLELARSYTRGKGFSLDGEKLQPDLSGIVVMATARVVVNPEQVKREEFGEYQVSPGTLYGWTIVELSVLNRYRKTSSSGPVPEPWQFPVELIGGTP